MGSWQTHFVHTLVKLVAKCEAPEASWQTLVVHALVELVAKSEALEASWQTISFFFSIYTLFFPPRSLPLSFSLSLSFFFCLATRLYLWFTQSTQPMLHNQWPGVALLHIFLSTLHCIKNA